VTRSSATTTGRAGGVMYIATSDIGATSIELPEMQQRGSAQE